MHNRRLGIIFGVVLVDMLSFSIVLPLLPYLAKEFGATAATIGLLTATYPFAQFFGAPLLGGLSDRHGRKPVLMLSIAGTALGFVILATAQVLPVLFLGRFLDGLTGGNISVAQAYISDVTEPEERGRALGMIGAAFGMGFILGPITGGLLSSISYTAPAWAGAVLALTNLVLVATLVPESLSPEDRARLSARKRRIFDIPALRAALAHHRVGPLLTIRSTTALSNAVFETSFTLWAIAALGVTARTTGLLLGYVGVLSVFVQAFLIGRLTKRFTDDWLVVSAIALAGASLTVWGFVSNLPALLVLMPAISIGIAVGNTVMTSALTKAVDRDEVGGTLGIQTSILSAARIVAPIMAGFLLQHGPVWAPGVVAGALGLSMVPYAWKTLCVRPGRRACDEEFDPTA
jgi:DHA1 family tetracycline resistance protein-like MFS transporter